MIGKLRGTVDELLEDGVILDVGGVGYLVRASARTLRDLKAGEAATLAIETQVREDAITLYGFRDGAEREWFRLLQSVQGVGARVALGVLSVMGPRELGEAVAVGDRAMVARAPGVGPKLAARLVAELRDRAPALAGLDPGAVALTGALEAGSAARPVRDAVSALVNLGYAQAQAAAAVAAASKGLGEGAEAGALIRRGLKELAQV